MKFIAKVNPLYLAAMHALAAQQDVRYYLNAVCIQPHPDGGVVLIATNGHVLGAIHDRTGWIKRGLKEIIYGRLGNRELTELKRKRRNGPPLGGLWIGERASVLAIGDEAPELFGNSCVAVMPSSVIDGVYPDWRKFNDAKADESRPMPWVNGRYIGMFNEVADITSGRNNFNGMRLIQTGDDTCPIAVRFGFGDMKDIFFGMIMPMRGDGPIDDAVPPFAKVQPKKRVKVQGSKVVPSAEVAPA